MKAIAVYPGKPDSVHLAELPEPSISEIPGGRGVVVRVLRVGVDGTDKEINAAEYGAAPEGFDFLVLGHEGFGRVDDRKLEIPADRINLDFVLGNKVMVGTVNANREHFETGVRDLVLAESAYPGFLSSLLTNPVRGLENYGKLFEQLTNGNGAIKVYCVVSEE